MGEPSGWKNRFKERIEEREEALGQPKRVSSQDFALYKRQVLELYDRVCDKVADIPQIEVSKPVISRSEQFRVDVKGVIETVHALVLRFHERRLELVPEGLNFGRSKGRVRIKHNGRGLSRFLYASLEAPPGEDAGALTWFLLDREKPQVGEDATSERMRALSDEVIEELLERVFLS